MLRRMRTAALAALAIGLVMLPAGSRAQAPMTERDCLRFTHGLDLQTATIPEIQSAMAARRITSAQLVDAYIARIHAYDTAGPMLNTIRDLNPTARAQADKLDAERRAGHVRGPLHGIPILLKDNIGTTDEPTTAGSIALEGSVPLHDAFVTARLREAGAVILGKTNLSEFAQWISLNNPDGYSSLGGQVREPYDLFGSPAGSSAGSGAAEAMAMAAGALGSETSLSILAPSQVSSLVGVKTTVGMVSRAGVIPLAPDFDTVGPMTTNVMNAAVILGAIAGPDPNDAKTAASASKLPPGRDFAAGLKPDALKGVRLAYSPADADALDADEGALWQGALDRLQKLGATLVATQLLDPGTGGNADSAWFFPELAALPNEFKASLNAYLAAETHPPTGVKTLADIIAFNSAHPDKARYGQELLQISDLTPGLAALGTAQSTPVNLAAGAVIDGVLTATNATAFLGPAAPGAYAAHGRIGAASGYPTVIIPMGYSGKVPIGLTFMGTAFSEAKLLAYAYAYEQAGHDRVPPTVLNGRQLKVVTDCPAPVAKKAKPKHKHKPTKKSRCKKASYKRKHKAYCKKQARRKPKRRG
jgi:amidase